MIDILIILATLVGLGVGGHYFVNGAAAIGKKCGLSPVMIGATIIAIGTSLPEWAVSVLAANKDMTDLAVGNVIGSNICNICIILGLAALVYPLDIRKSGAIRYSIIMLVATAMLILFASDGEVSQAEGIVLLLGSVITIIIIFRFGDEKVEPIEKFHWWQIPMTVAALALILVSSHFFVESAKEIARQMNIDPWIIGITVAAVGTSLPELVTALAAAWQRQTGMIIGNVVGSNIMNIFFVLGSEASIQNLKAGEFGFQQAALFSVPMVLAIFFMLTGKVLQRWEGTVLLAIGIGWYAVATV